MMVLGLLLVTMFLWGVLLCSVWFGADDGWFV